MGPEVHYNITNIICKFFKGAESNPTGAAVPSLGLSNQAVYTDKDLTEKQHPDNPKDEYSESYFIAQQFKGNNVIIAP